MHSRSERHKEYSDSRTNKKNKKEKRKIMSKDGSSLKYIHVICIVLLLDQIKQFSLCSVPNFKTIQ